MVPLLVPRDR